MKIKKLEEGMRGMFVDGTIVDISEPRTINTRNGPRSVADATLEDKTGRIKLSLWGDMIEKVKIGDEVTISGAYVKEFRGELQLNVSRSGTLETQDDRIATWIGHVKGWIAEDIENFREEASYRRKPRSEERTDALLYDGVTAKNLTVKELAEGRLPDDNLWQMNAEFVSKANQKYQARYFTRQARRAGWGEEDPFLVVSWIRRDSTDEEAAMDMEFYAAQRVEDFNHVREIFVRESNFVRQHFTPPDDTFKLVLKEDPTQSSVANFFMKNNRHLREVLFSQVDFRDVPKQVYQNSGLPPAELWDGSIERLPSGWSYFRRSVTYMDDEDYEQYVMNTALDTLLRSFVWAANSYRGGEEGFLYYYEDSGAVPNGIEWMNKETQGWPSSVVKRKVREMGEAYRQVIEEMGLPIPEETKTFLGQYLFPSGQT